MTTSNTRTLRDKLPRYVALLFAMALPLPARAEPSVASSSTAFLWIVSALACIGLAWIAVKLAGRGRWLATPAKKWGFALVLFVVLLLFLGPFIVAIGNILITGRTM